MKKTGAALLTIAVQAGLLALCAAFTAPAAALGAGDADAAIEAFNKAFLVTSDGNTYYKKSLKDSAADGTWLASLDIMAEEDAYDRTGSPAQKALVDDLCRTWLKNTPPGSATEPWKWDGWNDDLGWFSLALVRGYQITGNREFLTQAENGFHYAFGRGWDTKWNDGGIWEQQIEYCKNGAKISKETLSNDSLGLVACLLYQSTHEAVYLNRARQIYDWERSHLFDATTGQVSTGVAQDGTVDHGTAVYNQGTFVDYANYLYQITGKISYYNDAKQAIDFTQSKLTTGGVFSNSAGYLNTWADTFARGLGHFVHDNQQWSAYYPWMLQNADAAWGSRRTDVNLAWNGWTQPTPTDNALVTTKFVSAVAWLQYTPATPSVRMGGMYMAGVHALVRKQSGMALDSGPAGVAQRGRNGEQSQKWSFSQNADGSWNIVNHATWRALDDPSAAQVVQSLPSRASSQRWWIAQQPDGTCKIRNQASGLLLGSFGSSTDKSSKTPLWRLE